MKRSGRRTARRAGAALALALLPGCRAEPPPASRVLLATFDTTRADRIGAYGYEGARTPTLDRLAREGIVFEEALAPAPITLPSHASLLTGVAPPVHGVRDNGVYRLAPEARLISEVFRARGWRTAAFVGSFVLDRSFGLDQGFEVYRGPSAASVAVAISERPANEVADDAIAWLSEISPEESFFLWVHFMDPHAPYQPPPPWDAELADPYDAEIAFADAQLGRILASLEHREMTAGLLVVAAADHGEALGEHGEETHGLFLYRETIRVPLVLSGGPVENAAGRRVARAVSLTDVPRTLLELAKLPVTEMPALGPASLMATERAGPIYLETVLPYSMYRWRGLRGLVWRDHKLIVGRETELYARADPGETRDLASADPNRVASLRERLDAVVAELEAEETWADPRDVGAKERDLLASLGYAPARVGGDPFSERLPDPRERVEDQNRFHQATSLVAAASELAASRPSAAAWQEAELENERRGYLEPARAILRELQRNDPGNPQTLMMLGFVELELGETDTALALLERAAIEVPEAASLHYQLGRAYARVGRESDAVSQMHRAILLEPRKPAYYQWLAIHHKDAGELERAAWWAREALLAVDPDSPEGQKLERWRSEAAPEVHRRGGKPEPPPDFPVAEHRARVRALERQPRRQGAAAGSRSSTRRSRESHQPDGDPRRARSDPVSP